MMTEFIHRAAFIVFNMLFMLSAHAHDDLSMKELALARNIEFDPVILKKVKETGHSIEALTGISRSGNSVVVNGLSFRSKGQQAQALVERLGTEIEALGYRVYIQELGHGYIPDSIAIIKSRDQFDILRTRKTHAYTANLGNEQIIVRLKDWDKRYGLKLIGAGYNWVKARLVRSPDNISRFSREVVEFCPGVLSFRSGTLKQLERDIQKEHIIFLRWD
jgi:hypothetical protein